jgi:hypothetical protein
MQLKPLGKTHLKCSRLRNRYDIWLSIERVSILWVVASKAIFLSLVEMKYIPTYVRTAPGVNEEGGVEQTLQPNASLFRFRFK